MVSIFQAARNGCLFTLSELLAGGEDPNETSWRTTDRQSDIRHGDTPLCLVIRYGHTHCVETLIDAEANVTCKHLRSAVLHGHLEILHLLLGTGIDLNESTIMGDSIMHFAMCGENADLACVRAMYEYGGLLCPEMLSTAAEYNQKNVLNFLLEHDLDVNWKTECGDTALMRAARGCYWTGGHLDIMVTLIQKGANVNDIDNYGNSVMQHALKGILKGNDCLKLLLDEGATTNNIDFWAAYDYNNVWENTHTNSKRSKSFFESACLLTAHGADLGDDQEFLDKAIKNNEPDLIRFACSHDAVIDAGSIMNYFDEWKVCSNVVKTLETLTELGLRMDFTCIIHKIIFKNMSRTLDFVLERGAVVSESLYKETLSYGFVSPMVRASVENAFKSQMATVIQKHWRRYMVFKRTTDPGHPWGRALLQARARRYFPAH
jgi:ankyrin repeat protein